MEATLPPEVAVKRVLTADHILLLMLAFVPLALVLDLAIHAR